MKVVTVTTAEIEQDEPTLLGKYVFRDEAGAKFLWSPRPERHEFLTVATVAEADMVSFLCPACYEKNGGKVGTHGVMVTFAGRDVPTDAGTIGADGQPTRWGASGQGIDDLVLTPSIQLDPSAPPDSKRCRWHGFVGSSGIPPGHAG